MSAPVVKPDAGPRTTPTMTTADTAKAPKISPEGNKIAPTIVARICVSARLRAPSLLRMPKMRPAS